MLFTDPKSEYEYFKSEIEDEWHSIRNSGRYLFGPQVERLEQNFKELTGFRQAIAVKNCTDAISLILQVVWKPGMPVILPNFGAYPTAIAVARITGTQAIHFVDIDHTFCMDVSKLPDIRKGIIIPVNLFGNNAALMQISLYADKNNHIMITDCAQSTGSSFSSKAHLVNDEFKVFSFYPTKPLASMGDGGMIVTDNEFWANELRALRFYGNVEGTISQAGINSRMDEWQAAVVNAKMESEIDFKRLILVRRENAARYKKIISGMPEHFYNIWHQFPVLFKERDEVIIPELKKREIPFMIHYDRHISEQPVFVDNKTIKVGFRVNNKVISLPVHAHLAETDIQKVEQFLHDFKSYEAVTLSGVEE